MGKTFELIADHALEKLDDYFTECHICERENVDLYSYQGGYILENGEVDDDLYALCKDCIAERTVSHGCDFEYIKIIENYLDTLTLSEQERAALSALLIHKYQKTPDTPIFMQYHDRPLCCKDITEFKGYPENDTDLYHKTDSLIYWEKKAITNKPEAYNFKATGLPESFREIATFECKHCGKSYFTFQFT